MLSSRFTRTHQQANVDHAIVPRQAQHVQAARLHANTAAAPTSCTPAPAPAPPLLLLLYGDITTHGSARRATSRLVIIRVQHLRGARGVLLAALLAILQVRKASS